MPFFPFFRYGLSTALFTEFEKLVILRLEILKDADLFFGRQGAKKYS